MGIPADDHRHLRQLLGAYVLGQLEAGERTRLLAHLDGCPECRSEEGELREVAELLAEADPDRLADPAVPPSWLGDRVVSDVAALRRRRRWTMAAVAAVAATVVLAAALVASAGGPGNGDDELIPLAFGAAPIGVEASAGIEGKPWGTVVHLTAAGLDAGQVYNAWLARPDGSRVSAGTFRPDAGRNIRCYLSAALGVGEAAAFGVSTPDGETVLLASFG